MRTIAMDGRMGASGDMLLGALLDAGADRSALSPVEAALPVEYVVEPVNRNGIEATRVRVEYTGDSPHSVRGWGHAHSHDVGDRDEHRHDHSGDHSAHQDGTHHHRDQVDHDEIHREAPSAEGHGPTRTLAEIEDIVDGMDLPESVRDDAVATFELLAEAEAAVHGTDLASTTVHEVGADDAIADVTGTVLLLADLDVDRMVVPPVKAGSGTVSMAHGTYPVPAPAVVEIAERADWSLAGGPVSDELLTPTGAALLAHLGEGVDSLPTTNVATVGYGAGSRTYPDRPNVLRVLVGETDTANERDRAAGELALRREPIALVETTVDDVTPELLGSLQESLASVGALDVTVAGTTMKKSRPGHVVEVITAPENAQVVAARLARETGSLGVRVIETAHRWVADRSIETVSIDVDGDTYDVGVKVADDERGRRYDASAEYEDAATVARETGLAVRDVMRRAERKVDGSG